jgi:hypothetical protein
MTASMQKMRRLPGFYFETKTSLREDILPRMDVALFIGFAASGPIGVPVVLESAEQFNHIFGKNLPLVWDHESGKMLNALLPPTVRAFFRNGGKRCWVIRLASEKAKEAMPLNRACRNYFPLAGFASVQKLKKGSLRITPAFAKARSKGTWSDDLLLGTAVSSSSASFKNLFNSPEHKTLQLETDVKSPIKMGETLRLNYDEGLSLFLTVDSLNELSSSIEIISKRWIWLQKFPQKKMNGKVSVRIWKNQVRLNSKDFSQSALTFHRAILSTEFESVTSPPFITSPPLNNPTDSAGKVKLIFEKIKPSELPEIGSFMLTRFDKKWLCLQTEKINSVVIADKKQFEVICSAVYCRKEIGEPHSSPQVHRLSFELWLKQDTKTLLKLKDLAFNSGHERFWGNLPTDEGLFKTKQNSTANQTGNTISANFPVAGNNNQDSFFFPVFALAFPENYLSRVGLQGTKLEREGLAEFNEELFLDSELKNTGLNNLLNDAEFTKFISSTPRSLNGIHAALASESVITQTDNSQNNPIYTDISLNEAAIIAVPDALHRGWFKNPDKSAMSISLPAPEIPITPETGKFDTCNRKIIKSPTDLKIKSNISGGSFTLIWTNNETSGSPPNPNDEKLFFVLEESANKDFRSAVQIYSGKKNEFKISNRTQGEFYFRVKAVIGKVSSSWSNGLKLIIPAAENWAAISKADYSSDILLAVQRNLLRMCNARGDIFAVLGLPEHYEKDDVLLYAKTLKAQKGEVAATFGVEPFNFDELKALSYGAIYHSWLLTKEEGFDEMQTISACGFAAGVMAQRSIKRGAWVAPANEILVGVLGLTQDYSREDLLDFQANAINPLRNEPVGFMALSSETLSRDFELSSINVRRLLSLLRRLAMKHGNEYVFETNSERFRRQVQQGFASLLDLMFTRGAFAGKTPATSYQVVVSDALNHPRSVDQGRLIVELKVAPSQPLKFVTVRLAQTGGKSEVSEIV